MADPPQPSQSPPQQQAPAAGGREDMLACVAALEAALLPCLPARELQAVDRSLQSAHQTTAGASRARDTSELGVKPLLVLDCEEKSHPVDVERHARDFMEAAKKLQSYFISLQREERPTTEDMLRKEIATMEEELKTKAELIAKHKNLIEGWHKELKEQLGKHITELERV